MNEYKNYVTIMETKYEQLELINIPQMVEECPHKWFNQTLTEVNDSVVRLGILEGEYHWHQHANEDEFFLVLEGELLIDLEDKTIELKQHQGITIPKGVQHRPRALQKAVVLMVETNTITPTGD